MLVKHVASCLTLDDVCEQYVMVILKLKFHITCTDLSLDLNIGHQNDTSSYTVEYVENFRGGQVSSQSCDVTNQLETDHSRGVRGHAPGKILQN